MEQRFADEWARIAPIVTAARGEEYVGGLDLARAEIIVDEIPRYDGVTREMISFRFGPDGPIYGLTRAGDVIEAKVEHGRQRKTVFAPDGRELRSYVKPPPGMESMN